MAVENSIAVMPERRIPSSKEDKEHHDKSAADRKSDIEDASYWNFLFIFISLATCSLNGAILLLIPRKNSIIYQEFWYETLVYMIVGYVSRFSVSHILELFIFTKVQELLQTSHYLKVFSTMSLSCAIPYCLSYVTWTWSMGNNHPLPFHGLLGITLGDLSVNIVFFWFLFPPNIRKQDGLKIKAKAFLIYRTWAFLQSFAIEMMSIIANSQLQWMLILVLPSVRTLSISIAEIIVKKYLGVSNGDVEFLVKTDLMISYTVFFTGRISNLDQSTVYGTLTMELALHLVSCYRIIKLIHKVEGDDLPAVKETKAFERKVQAQTLVMSEFTEAMVPIVFAIVSSMVFFGPNVVLFKDVGNNYFGGRPIDDVEPFYFGLFQMFSIDMIAMILSGISLKYLCCINLFQEFCNVMQKYWLIFAVKLPTITAWYLTKDVNGGMDDSMEFSWITKKGRDLLICNAVELMDAEKALLVQNCTVLG